MSNALAAASNAVRRLTIDESIHPAEEDLPPYWGIEMEAALVVASWTPEGGLIGAWIGDSIPFLLPAAGGRCWAGEPMSMSGTLVAGDFAITPTGLPNQSLADSTRWLSASIPRGEVDGIIESEGLVVALLSDGAHNAWTEDCPCLDEGWGATPGQTAHAKRPGTTPAPAGRPGHLPTGPCRSACQRQGDCRIGHGQSAPGRAARQHDYRRGQHPLGRIGAPAIGGR